MLYRILKPLSRFIFGLCFRVKIEGKENLPEGAYMLCSNHMSNWDPPIYLTFFKRKIHFLGKKELFENPFLRRIVTAFGMIPLKRGQADMAAIKTAISTLNSGEVLGIFPAGTRTKTVEAGQAKSGAALIGARCGCKVVPVSIRSNYRLFSKIHIKIGQYIDLSEYKGQKLDNDQLQSIADNIYSKIIELYEEA